MRGIEAACWGSIGSEIELRTSKAGKPFVNFNLAVVVGQDENGKPVSQWVRVAIFGDLAQQFAERASKGDRCYVEGSLSLNTWQGNDGQTKVGLNLAAWHCEKLPAIGQNRQFREKGHAVSAHSFKQPYQREKPKVMGLLLNRNSLSSAQLIDKGAAIRKPTA